MSPNIKSIDFVGAMKNATFVIQALSADGITVKGITLAGQKPVIRIQHCGFCDKLINTGKASYVEFGCGTECRYRQGQYLTGGCKVVWSESLH